MKYLLVIVIFCLTGFSIEAKSPKNHNDGEVISNWLEESEACRIIAFDKKILTAQYKKSVNCYIDTLHRLGGQQQRNEIVNYLADKILALDLSKESLSKMLKITVSTYSSNIKLIKRLVDRGASTMDISISMVSDHNDIFCEPIELILEKNKELYRENTPFDKTNSADAGDIFILVNTYASHHSVCVKAIEQLISYYPEAVNLNSDGIPLKYLLYNPGSSDVPPEIAMKLLSATNVNMTDNRGDTAIHTFINNNHYKGINSIKKYQKVIDKFIKLGGNLDLKNNNGFTVRELLNKYPE